MVFMNFSLIKNSVIKYLRVHITSINRLKIALSLKCSLLLYSGRCIITCRISAGKLETNRRVSPGTVTGARVPAPSDTPPPHSGLQLL